LKKKSKAEGITILDFKFYYKAVVIKTLVLAQKQVHRSMEQKRKPRNGPTAIWSTNLQQSSKEYPMEKKTVSPTNGVGKTGQKHAKE